MEKINPKLSLCIPTNGAVYFLQIVLDSIYQQGCDESLFEVIVCDNAKNGELKDLIENYRHDNIFYYQELHDKSY